MAARREQVPIAVVPQAALMLDPPTDERVITNTLAAELAAERAMERRGLWGVAYATAGRHSVMVIDQ